jgi:hypothetical protein
VESAVAVLLHLPRSFVWNKPLEQAVGTIPNSSLFHFSGNDSNSDLCLHIFTAQMMILFSSWLTIGLSVVLRT